MLQELFQIRYAFFHLDIAFSTFKMIFLFQTVASPIFNYIRMRVHLKLAKQLNLLSEYKLTHIIFKSDFLYTFYICIIIFYLIYIAISPTNYFLPFY